MSVSIVKPPRHVSDTVLRKTAADSFNRGGSRIAAGLLTVPARLRETIVTAGHIFTNTSPGWRLSDGTLQFVYEYHRTNAIAGAYAIVNRESGRRDRERALNADITKPRVLVDFDGTVRSAASAMGD